MGCARTSDFTMLSTKNVLLGIDQSKCKGTYEGKDSRSIIIFIPLGIPDIKEAADKAVERGGGNMLMNAVLYQEFWYVPLIYGEISYIVKGDVYQVDEALRKRIQSETKGNQ